MGAAIEVLDISKKFRLNTERHSSLKERVVRRKDRRAPPEAFWALKDVAFDVQEGHTVGLLGHNGSGKSTLLKCIGGILQPTSGEIHTRGRLASLLELGAGFHPDLTGRENVYLNASILGLTKRDIDARFDDIVGFAELEQFIDEQVKHYSSGMYVRLGFAVATNVDPDILLVDEVLAVGDESFQRKCLDRVGQFQREGRTIVFVTHGADLVRQICDRAVVLDHGAVIAHDLPSEAVRAFREGLFFGGGMGAAPDAATSDQAGSAASGAPQPADKPVRITSVTVVYPEDGRRHLWNGEPLRLLVGYDAGQPVVDAVFAVTLHATDGHIVWGVNSWATGVALPPLEGIGEVAFEFPSVPLLEGIYPLTVGIHDLEGNIHDWREQHDHVDVLNRATQHAWGVADLPVTVTSAS